MWYNRDSKRDSEQLKRPDYCGENRKHPGKYETSERSETSRKGTDKNPNKGREVAYGAIPR